MIKNIFVTLVMFFIVFLLVHYFGGFKNTLIGRKNTFDAIIPFQSPPSLVETSNCNSFANKSNPSALSQSTLLPPIQELKKSLPSGNTEVFTTLDGDVYEGVVKKVEPDGLGLRTSSGYIKLRFKNLPDDLKNKYGYDPTLERRFLEFRQAQAVIDHEKYLREQQVQNLNHLQELAKSTEEANISAINQSLDKQPTSYIQNQPSTKPSGSYSIVFQVMQVLEFGCTARIMYFNDQSQSHFPYGIVYIRGCSNVGEGSLFQAYLVDDGLFDITRDGVPSKLKAYSVVDATGKRTTVLQKAPDIAPMGYPSSGRSRVGGGW